MRNACKIPTFECVIPNSIPKAY